MRQSHGLKPYGALLCYDLDDMWDALEGESLFGRQLHVSGDEAEGLLRRHHDLGRKAHPETGRQFWSCRGRLHRDVPRDFTRNAHSPVQDRLPLIGIPSKSGCRYPKASIRKAAAAGENRAINIVLPLVLIAPTSAVAAINAMTAI